MMAIRRPESVEVKLDLKVISLSGTWRPNDAERRAAWEIYVELITRVSGAPLQNGLLREALTSLYSLFATSRDVLRRYGPELAEPKPEGQYSLGLLTVLLLNAGLRPVLSYWHPELEDWEAQRAPGVSRLAHETAWPRSGELRAMIEATREALSGYGTILAQACGVPDLMLTARQVF